jgi:glutathione synthase/RimK-type ligase-like ATP-grasp enzyme
MILISSGSGDIVTKSILARLEKLESDYFMIDEDKILQELFVDLEGSCGEIKGIIGFKEKILELEDIHAIYVRHSTYQSSVKNTEELQKIGLINEYQLVLDSIFDKIPCKVINRRNASLSNNSKPYQQLIIKKCGFSVPRTLITNSPNEVAKFYKQHQKEIIYKSISGIRSIVRKLKNEDLKRLNLVRNCITQFQEYIEGDNVRVHTIGKKIFATKVVSAAVDYRYASQEGQVLRMESYDLPNDIGEKCMNLTKSLGLVLAGIDLKVTPENDYFCFEVNPSPAFLYYELYTHQPISAAIANELMDRQ